MSIANPSLLENEQGTSGVQPSRQLCKLFGQVVEYFHHTRQPTSAHLMTESGEGEVLLEIELGGSKYTLLRSETGSIRADLQLSPREKEIVILIARGLPNKTIANTLNISPWTVSTYVKRIFSKFNVRSRAEMVARAMAARLIRF